MRLRRLFRPSVSDYLESRVVPSLATVSPPPAVLGHVVTLPPQVQNGDRIHQAFEAFAKNYEHAVHSVLLAPGPDGSIIPSMNRQAFDERIKQALTSLANQLVQSLGDVPLNSPEVTQVVDAIIGDGSDSLESQLLGLATATIVQDVSSGALTGDTLQTITQTSAQVTQEIIAANAPLVTQAITTPSPVVAAVGNNDVTIDTSSSLLHGVRQVFSTFMIDYFQSLKDVLLAAGEDGTIDPKSHRADFDAKVTSSLQSLVESISGSAGPRGLTLSQTLLTRELVQGDDPGSLKNQLASLATPTGPEAALVRDFTLGSFRTIVSFFTRISGGFSEDLS